MTIPRSNYILSTSAEPTRRETRWILAGMLCLVLGIGVYLIATCTMISKDGVLFIHQAQRMETDPGGAVDEFRQHPGYPVLILVARRALALPLSPLPEPLRWAVAGQTVALLSRLVALWFAYGIARRLCGVRAALAGLAVIAVLPRPTEYGSDVLSDWPFLALACAGYGVLLTAMQHDRPWRLAGVGVLAGAAYLIRPEAVMVLAAAWPWAAWRGIRPHQPIRTRLTWISAALLMTVLAAACIWPYVQHTGMLYSKHNIFPLPKTDASSLLSAPLHATACLAGAGAEGVVPLLRALGLWVVNLIEISAGYPLLFVIIGMAIVVRADHDRRAVLCYFLGATLAGYLFVLLAFATASGYISHRHLLIQVLLCIGPLGVGIQVAAKRLYVRMRGLSMVRWLGLAGLTWGIAAILALPLGIRSLRAIRGDRADMREATKWLAAHSDPDNVVLVSDSRMTFYLGRPTHPHSFWTAFGEHSTARDLWSYVYHNRAPWAMVRHRVGLEGDHDARLIEAVGTGTFTPIRRFRKENRETVIYRVDPSRLVPAPPPRPVVPGE